MVSRLLSDWKVLSWEKSSKNLFRLQARIFRVIFISNYKKALLIQKLLLKSNSIRLLSIREITQLSSYKKFSGVDGKITLTFLERVELSEFLKIHFFNWKPQLYKKVHITDNRGTLRFFSIPTVADRVWQSLAKFALEPAHEAVFHPHNCGFRNSCSIFNSQKLILLNINKSSFGSQKRILKVNLEPFFIEISKNYVIQKLICPRTIKLGVFRFFNVGFDLKYPENYSCPIDLSTLLSHIALSGLESLHYSIRFGYELVFFLKPVHNEYKIIQKLKTFFSFVSLSVTKSFTNFTLFSTLQGFDFLGWHFKILKSGQAGSYPSFNNYQLFLRRVKHIINNSNYGAVIKSLKLFPIVFNWRSYHQFCNMDSFRNSLFYIKKKAFKIFNNESKQDSYSSKRLVDKSFVLSPVLDTKRSFSPYYGHLSFWLEEKFCTYPFYNKKTLCIFCGNFLE
uniref:Ycf13 n=1 Tax=Euglenaformis proxima TaxID=299110 RepID=A0A023HHN4_9EUGL|nr:ycf13 [Euglenaformis proxima]AGL11987.1 ycf13 [Euglenaformis proxima]